MRIWVKERIEIWVDDLAISPDSTYNDCETVWRHPFLLRLRMKLALWRIQRRQRKLAAFAAKNP
jgi:hypothetical protein